MCKKAVLIYLFKIFMIKYLQSCKISENMPGFAQAIAETTNPAFRPCDIIEV